MHRLQTKTKWWALCLLAFLSVATPLLPYLSVSVSAASQTTLTYVNYNEIDVTNNYPSDYRGLDKQQGKFTLDKSENIDCGIGGLDFCNNLYYTPTGSGDGNTTGSCIPQIKVEANKNSGIAYKSTVHMQYAEHSVRQDSTCQRTTVDTTPQNYDQGHVTFFNWIDSNRIDPVGPLPEVDSHTHRGNVLVKYGSFTKIPDGTYADVVDTGFRCKSYLDNIDSSNTQAALHLWNQGGSGTCDNDFKDTMQIRIGDPSKASATPDPKNTPVVGSGGGTSSGVDKATCEGTGIVLGWIICPTINLLSSAVEGIYSNLIKPLLETKPLSVQPNTVDPVTHLNTNPNLVVWSTFRIIGDVFLLIALLVIVFGQSLGGGLIDAYAAKKILPRLLAAAIFINISYYIVAFAVDVSNIVGGGIQSLILAPFKIAHSEIQVGVASGSLGIASTIGATGSLWVVANAAAAGTTVAAAAGETAVAASTAGVIGAFVIDVLPVLGLFILLPAILLMIAILAVVIFRQALILLLVLLAPIAFALYCLPNTEQYFRKWWDLFLKTLLVYPIIAVLFALGNVFAITITRADGPAVLGPLKALLGIIALLVPLFLIPFAFKLAGGVLGRAFDVMGGGGKKGLEMLKGNPNDPESLGRRMRYRGKDAVLSRREAAVGSLTGEKSTRAKRRIGRMLDYGNMQATRSKITQERAEAGRAQYSSGEDSNRRDSFIAWDESYETTDDAGKVTKGGWFRRMDMEMDSETGQLKAVPGTGAIYRNFDRGAEAKRKALSLYGGRKSDFQENLFYETKKTGFDEIQIARMKDQYSAALADYGLSEEVGVGVAEGVGFAHAGQSLSGKHNKRRQQPDGSFAWKTDIFGLTKDGSLQTDNYAWGKQDRQTFKDLQSHYGTLSDTVTQANTAKLADDHVFDSGPYKGKSLADVRQTQSRIERTAALVNPAQRGSQQTKTTEIDGEPQMAGGFGISSAPVDVQAAAAELHEAVKIRMQAEGRGAPKVVDIP